MRRFSLAFALAVLFTPSPGGADRFSEDVEATVDAFLASFRGSVPALTSDFLSRSSSSTGRAWDKLHEAHSSSARMEDFVEARSESYRHSELARVALRTTEILRSRMGAVDADLQTHVDEGVSKVAELLSLLQQAGPLAAGDPSFALIEDRIQSEVRPAMLFHVGKAKRRAGSERTAADQLWELLSRIPSGGGSGGYTAAPPPREISPEEMARREAEYEEWLEEQERREIEKRRLESERVREELDRRNAPPPETPKVEAESSVAGMAERSQESLPVAAAPTELERRVHGWYDLRYLPVATEAKAALGDAVRAPKTKPNVRVRACARLLAAATEALHHKQILDSPDPAVSTATRGMFQALLQIGEACARGDDPAPLLPALQPILQATADALRPYRLTP